MSDNLLHKISWKDSIWFSDVDDTLITTADSSIPASDGIRSVFTSRFGEAVGIKLQNEFIEVFTAMLSIHRGNETASKYDSLIEEIESYHKDLPAEYGKPKRWSREIFIAIAAKKLGIRVSEELICEAADAYWMNLTQIAGVIPGVIPLVKEIKRHNRPFYLVTGSDVRLSQRKDGRFSYDPHYSESFKRERLAILRQRGIDFNLVSIGDPEDKPHKDFFEKAVHVAEEDLGEKINLSNAIIIGDSFAADLQTPKEQMHFGLSVLYEKGKDTTEIFDKHQLVTGNLSTIIDYLS
jgi:hypothetical protein